MTEAVFQFAAINRRLNRKPERQAVSLADVSVQDAMAALRAELDENERLIRENRAARALMATPETVTESELLDLRLLADKRQIEDDGWETLFSF